MPVTITRLPQKALVPLLVGDGSTTPDTDTTGDTVGAYLAPIGGGTAVLVGTTTGAAANTQLTINMDLTTSGITAGSRYELEVVADVSGSNPKTLIPNATTGYPYVVEVYDVQAVT